MSDGRSSEHGGIYAEEVLAWHYGSKKGRFILLPVRTQCFNMPHTPPCLPICRQSSKRGLCRHMVFCAPCASMPV